MNQRIINDTDQQTFITYDLALACALLTSGLIMLDLDTSESLKAGFVFHDDGALRERIKKYWNDQLVVNPRMYFNMLKDLKSRIYTRKRY